MHVHDFQNSNLKKLCLGNENSVLTSFVVCYICNHGILWRCCSSD